MRKALPFLFAPKTDIRAVGNSEVGIIHLQSKGGISPNENPIDLQKVSSQQAEVQLMLQKAIARLAQQEGISKAEARKQLFAQPVRDAQTGAETEDDTLSLYDHLTIEETRELFQLQTNQSETALRAAALFIRSRVAYPVQLAAEVKVKAKQLQVEPLSFAIDDGQQIKFGSVTVTVKGVHEEGCELIDVLDCQAISKGKIGYLCERGSSKVKIGDPEWTADDTEDCLTEGLIGKIYEFYQQEASGLSEDEIEADQGKDTVESSMALAPSS
jgi:hypothetical protein